MRALAGGGLTHYATMPTSLILTFKSMRLLKCSVCILAMLFKNVVKMRFKCTFENLEPIDLEKNTNFPLILKKTM